MNGVQQPVFQKGGYEWNTLVAKFSFEQKNSHWKETEWQVSFAREYISESHSESESFIVQVYVYQDICLAMQSKKKKKNVKQQKVDR